MELDTEPMLALVPLINGFKKVDENIAIDEDGDLWEYRVTNKIYGADDTDCADCLKGGPCEQLVLSLIQGRSIVVIHGYQQVTN